MSVVQVGQTGITQLLLTVTCTTLRDNPQVTDLIPKPVDAGVLVQKIRAHCC